MALQGETIKQSHNRLIQRRDIWLQGTRVSRSFVLENDPLHLAQSSEELNLLALDEG